jgi:hypothetical protein
MTSLMRQARRRLGALRGGSGSMGKDRVLSTIRQVARREPLQLTAVVVIVVGGLFVPALFSSTWIPKSSAVERSLPVIWQVLGAAMGLTIAVLIFSFQSFARSPYAGSLREFARYTYALPIALLGFLALLVDGLAYLGLGTNAPYGWAGVWAILVSLLSIASLPALTIVLLRGLEPKALHRSRLAYLSEIVARDVEQDIVRRLALVELREHCEAAGWDFKPLFGTPTKDGWLPVKFSEEGIVRDLDLSVIERHSVATPDQDMPVLLVDLGQRVVAGSQLALLPPGSSDDDRRSIERMVRVRRRGVEDSSLEEAIRLQHKQSRQAIREGDPVSLDEIGKAYKELLTALPKAWSGFGAEVFHEGLARPIDLISRSPVDVVSRQIFLEMRAAVRSRDAELVEEVLGTIYSILLEAAPLQADALSKAASSLLVHAYTLAAASRDAEIRDVGTDLPSTYLLEFLATQLYQLRPEATVDAQQDAAERQCRIVAVALTDLLRAAIDSDRDSDIPDIHRALLDRTSLWLRWRGDPDPAAQALIRLVEYEEEQRIGLAMWAVRAGRRGQKETARKVLNYFAESFPGTAAVLGATDRAIRSSIEKDEWLNWSEGPRFGGTFSPAVDDDLLEAALILCLLSADDLTQVDLGGGEIVGLRLERATQLLNSLDDEALSWLFVDHERLVERRNAFLSALDAAAATQRLEEQERVRAATLDETLVQRLDTNILAKWNEYALVQKLFERLHRATVIGERPENPIAKVISNLPRTYFIGGASAESIDFIATEIGRGLARMELEFLIATAMAAPLQDANGSITDRLNSLLTRVAAKSAPMVILMPVNPRIEIGLGLRAIGGFTQGVSPLFGPPGVGQWYRGEVRGVPVVQHHSVPRDRMIVLAEDWASYAEWQDVTLGPVTIDHEDLDTPDLQISVTATNWSALEVMDSTAAAAFRVDDLALEI